MGCKRNPKIYNLKFDSSTDYPGLEVQVRTMTMGQLFRVWTNDDASNGSAPTFEMFLDRIVSWNLEEGDGTPVPVTREAIEGEDDDLISAILKQWVDAIRGVPTPLAADSDSGETPPVGLSLAAASSPNPGN